MKVKSIHEGGSHEIELKLTNDEHEHVETELNRRTTVRQMKETLSSHHLRGVTHNSVRSPNLARTHAL